MQRCEWVTGETNVITEVDERRKHTRPRPHMNLVRDCVVVRVVECPWLVVEDLQSFHVVLANGGSKDLNDLVLQLAVDSALVARVEVAPSVG
jgi:hypothetical protein